MSSRIREPVELSHAQIERMHRLAGAVRLLDADADGAVLIEWVNEQLSGWIGVDGQLDGHTHGVPADDPNRYVTVWAMRSDGPLPRDRWEVAATQRFKDSHRQ